MPTSALASMQLDDVLEHVNVARQAEVLGLLERGRSTTQIAAELHLSVETVRNHIRQLLRATGTHSRLEAVAIANERY